MHKGKCVQCESMSHVIADCTEYAKIQLENKKRIEAQGKRWFSWVDGKAMKAAKTQQVHLTSNQTSNNDTAPPKSTISRTNYSKNTARSYLVTIVKLS